MNYNNLFDELNAALGSLFCPPFSHLTFAQGDFALSNH